MFAFFPRCRTTSDAENESQQFAKNTASLSLEQSSAEKQTYDPSPPGLPDGLFSKQKSEFGKILVGLRLENVDVLGIFEGHFGYFMTICYILCSFGTFFRFGHHIPR
jgi:hypothetical protein